MAKRKRLMPARGLELNADGTPPAGFARETPETKSMSPLPPIAAMAGEISQTAALDEMSEALSSARAEGRLAEALPLDRIVDDHLIRDRAHVDAEEMAALIESLRTRGQQVPIEVTDLGSGRYGLISGWRRLSALRSLAAEGQGAGTVLAVLRRPEGAAEAYLAMVEENEIRADLGFWERGRIAARALEAGVFSDTKDALNGLFGSVSRARRSKIGSFMLLAQTLDGTLRFPEALTERTGLALAKWLKDAEEGTEARAAALGAHLARANPGDAAAEWAAISDLLAEGGRAARPNRPKPAKSPAEVGAGGDEVAPGVFLSVGTGTPARSLTLSGPGVTAAFRSRLRAWVETGI